jgi:hypothetical protein
MRFKPTEPPPCLYCTAVKTTDVTPDDAAMTDRWYECPSCLKRFAVRFIQVKPPDTPYTTH